MATKDRSAAALTPATSMTAASSRGEGRPRVVGEAALTDENGKCEFRARSAATESEHVDRVIRRAVARAKEGDEEALRVLYLKYADNVYGYVRSIVRDHHDAEDVTQHVFAKLMTVLVKYDQRSVPFLGWLLRLAHNAAIDHLRKRRAVPTEEIYGADTTAPEPCTESSMALQEALEVLTQEQRSVVLMRHVRGLTPAEIAVRMGRSESSIHGLHHRGRRLLQEELARLGSTPSTRPPARA